MRRLRACLALLLAFCNQLSTAARSNTTHHRNTASAYSLTVKLRESPLWPKPHFLRHRTSAEHTRWGRPIPGLATKSRCCGRTNPVPTTRVAGGAPAGRHQFPWLAALVEPGHHRPFCGGSLINDRYVLTAAHCLLRRRPRHLQVVLGKHELRRDSGGDVRLNASAVRRHPLFGPLFLGFDVGLVRLETPLSLPTPDNRIAPVCLPERGRYRRATVTAAGWGAQRVGGPRTDRPHSVTLQQVPAALCRILNSPVPVTGSMVCAAGSVWSGGRDTCHGDSGGPLTVSVDDEGRQALLGVTSWGLGCARPLSAGVYARVAAALDWILANTQDANYC
ncbi:trypsin-1-like [Amphibalanus amphitrite]|uniref:trypsin-1-like n=1 Tax=Amphibalanus amphitrite TaxID=1232801 RepID=UPI001C910C0C|nr:trypsin-1-like [Amphibalanus amphitrite]